MQVSIGESQALLIKRDAPVQAGGKVSQLLPKVNR